MARFPRDIQQKEAVAAFVELGGRERPGKGSHRVVTMPNGRSVSIPAGDVKVGLLKRAIQTADLTDDAFLRAAGR